MNMRIRNTDMKAAVMFTAPFILAVVFIVSFSMHAFAKQNDMKFDLDRWDEGLLSALEAGPKILSRDAEFSVAPFPENDSAETQAELKMLHDFVSERDDETKLRIVREGKAGLGVWTFFTEEGLLDANNYKTLKLLKLVDHDLVFFILQSKMFYSRPRPSDLDETLPLYIFNPGHPAYPSGHGAQSYMVGLILSDFDPENAEKYMQFARDVGHRREIAGLHFPSDTAAGRKLATDVLAALRDVKIFEKKYQDAKASYVKPTLKITELNQKED